MNKCHRVICSTQCLECRHFPAGLPWLDVSNALVPSGALSRRIIVRHIAFTFLDTRNLSYRLYALCVICHVFPRQSIVSGVMNFRRRYSVVFCRASVSCVPCLASSVLFRVSPMCLTLSTRNITCVDALYMSTKQVAHLNREHSLCFVYFDILHLQR